MTGKNLIAGAVPEGALVMHVIILGKTRSGKSSKARLIVEHCLEQGQPVGIIDPKGDWWGIKLSKTGKSAGLALLAEPVDFIGPVFSELSADAGMGQFFTPHHLSYFMAKAIISDAKAMLGDKPFITLAEPACGVGGMILAANVVLREAGLDVATRAHWTAIDVDHRAVCGCYLQLSLTDCSADVYRGNSLGDPKDLVGTRTLAAMLFPKIGRRDEPSPPPPAPPSPSPEQPAQLTLF